MKFLAFFAAASLAAASVDLQVVAIGLGLISSAVGCVLYIREYEPSEQLSDQG